MFQGLNLSKSGTKPWPKVEDSLFPAESLWQNKHLKEKKKKHRKIVAMTEIKAEVKTLLLQIRLNSLNSYGPEMFHL